MGHVRAERSQKVRVLRREHLRRDVADYDAPLDAVEEDGSADRQPLILQTSDPQCEGAFRVILLRYDDLGSKPCVRPKAVGGAIELLLETKRQNPNGGGGGGGGNPGGGGKGTTRSAALASLGPGGDPNANIQARPVGQATGRAGKEFPEEFRSGLDAYFSNLEGTGKP